jgi:hypothetical protein
MYVDKEHEYKEGEVELDEISLHILRAIDYLNEHGWCQFDTENPGGQVCLQGALIATDRKESRASYGTFMDANGRITKLINGGDPYTYSHHWNDMLGRTKDEVVAKMREAAYLGNLQG